MSAILLTKGSHSSWVKIVLYEFFPLDHSDLKTPPPHKKKSSGEETVRKSVMASAFRFVSTFHMYSHSLKSALLRAEFMQSSSRTLYKSSVLRLREGNELCNMCKMW